MDRITISGHAFQALTRGDERIDQAGIPPEARTRLDAAIAVDQALANARIDPSMWPPEARAKMDALTADAESGRIFEHVRIGDLLNPEDLERFNAQQAEHEKAALEMAAEAFCRED